MALLNVHLIQAKLTSYMDLEETLQQEIKNGRRDVLIEIQLETLSKIIHYLLANEEEWLNKENSIIYEIADSIVKHHYCEEC
jgi:hypothetical protein